MNVRVEIELPILVTTRAVLYLDTGNQCIKCTSKYTRFEVSCLKTAVPRMCLREDFQKPPAPSLEFKIMIFLLHFVITVPRNFVVTKKKKKIKRGRRYFIINPESAP